MMQGDFYWSDPGACEPDDSTTTGGIIVSDRCVSSESLPAGGMMQCYRGFYNTSNNLYTPSETGTEYRCSCWRMFPLTGEQCDEYSAQSGKSGAYIVQAWFVAIIVISLYVAYMCLHGYLVLFVDNRNQNTTNRKSFKRDIAAQTALFLGFGSLAQAGLYVVFLLRSMPGGIDNATYYSWVGLLPLVCVLIFQSQVGISLAWLEIAEKSAKMSGKGGTLALYGKVLKVVAVLMFTLIVALYFMGRTSLISAVGTLLGNILAVSMHIGGNSLSKVLLSNAQDAEDKGVRVAYAIQSTIRIILCSQPGFILSMLYYITVYNDVNATGNQNIWGITIPVNLMGMFNLLSAFCLFNFIYTCRIEGKQKKNGKIRKSKLFGSNASSKFGSGSSVAPTSTVETSDDVGGPSTIGGSRSSAASNTSSSSSRVSSTGVGIGSMTSSSNFATSSVDASVA